MLSTTLAKLFANVHFKVRFGNNFEWYSHLPIGSIVKKHVVAINTQQPTSEITLSVNRLARLHFGVATCEALIIGAFVQAALKPGRRYFQRVRRMNKVFHVEDRAQMKTHIRAIIVGYTLRLINENTHDRLVFRAGDLAMNQLEAMVDCDPFSDLLNPLRNRVFSHSYPQSSFAQKKKWARTHRTRPCAFEQAVDYTESICLKQPEVECLGLSDSSTSRTHFTGP